jgi:hypothetical protein
MIDATPDSLSKPQPAVTADEFVEFAINLGFYAPPHYIDPDDSSDEAPMKKAPPFLRFSVNITAKDARIVKEILLAADIAFVSFDIQQTDSQAGYYRLVTTRE